MWHGHLRKSVATAIPIGFCTGARYLPRFVVAARSSGLSGDPFWVGVLKKTLATEPIYADLVAQQCGIMVPGHELKWDALKKRTLTPVDAGAEQQSGNGGESLRMAWR